MKNRESEFIHRRDGTEVCRECGHLWSDEGISHYPECRYFFVDEDNDNEDVEVVLAPPRSVTVKTAA